MDDADLALRALRTSRVPGEVVVTHDGVEALEYLFGVGAYAGRDLRAMPACLLLDLKLPKLDGLEVLRRLRADPRTRLIPIVILTSSCEPQDIRAAYRLGANSYICKPANFSLLRRCRAASGALLARFERSAVNWKAHSKRYAQGPFAFCRSATHLNHLACPSTPGAQTPMNIRTITGFLNPGSPPVAERFAATAELLTAIKGALEAAHYPVQTRAPGHGSVPGAAGRGGAPDHSLCARAGDAVLRLSH